MKINRSKKIQALPLQLVLIVPFILQIFGAVGLVGYLSFKNGQKAVNTLADQLMERTSGTVNQHLDSYLSIPIKIIQMDADAIHMGLLNVRDRQTLGKYFWHQMQAYDLTYIGIGLTTGKGGGAGRYDGKNVVIDEWDGAPHKGISYATDNQGNRTQKTAEYDWDNFKESWYTEPMKVGKPVWSRIYTINYPNYPYIAASVGRPIYDVNNRPLGMVAADVHLLKLSDFLKSIDVSNSGHIFILERNGMLIANSSKEQPFTKSKGEINRLKAIDSPDPLVREITKQLQQRFNNLQGIREAKKLRLDLLGEFHYITVTPWRDQYGLDWLVVVSVPEHTFMAQINANTSTTIWLCLGALGIACAIGLFTSHWITQPILKLNKASEAMASGNLDQTVQENSSIQELNILGNSFNHMVGQLRELFTKLEKSNEELEDRVEQRTVELQNTLTQLQRTQAQVIQSEKMSSLGQLVAGVAHEINNPVNFIHGNLIHAQQYTQYLLDFIQLYQQHYPNPIPEIQAASEEMDLEFLEQDLPKMLNSMKIGTDRIRQIVLSLRNFSRMDEAEFKQVNLHEGIDSTLMILQHRLKGKPERAEIEVIKKYNTLPLVECYAGQLNQVFMNILTNAIDALEESNAKQIARESNPKPNQITIRTSVIDSQWVQIAIADNGPGIPQDVQQRIFDPFFTTKPIGKGTGMGMSISYQIITEKHNGELECFSTPGEGTEFVIQIPIR